MRTLPNLQTLRDAVERVIQSNTEDGYTPHRFIEATSGGFAPNLCDVCRRLINKPETLEWLENALSKYPTLLTLEDFVSRRGEEWGFDAATIDMAAARAERFDQIAGGVRYS